MLRHMASVLENPPAQVSCYETPSCDEYDSDGNRHPEEDFTVDGDDDDERMSFGDEGKEVFVPECGI